MERANRGFTLVELVVSMTVVTLLVGVVVNLVISTADSQKYAERLSRATLMSQDLINGMRQELASSVLLFDNDAMGNGHLGMLELDPQAPLLPGSSLPTIDSTGIFQRETAARSKTGNTAFFTQHGWTTEFTCSSTNSYRIDVYRFVLYYLSPVGGGPRPGSGIGLNLCKFVGEPMADGSQVDRISDPVDRQEVLSHLVDSTPDSGGSVHPRVDLVWIRGGDPVALGTLRQIETGTYTLSDTPLSPRGATWTILRDEPRSSAGLLYYRHFSVATNHARPSWGVARFGVVDPTGSGFPHGFETQIVGPSSGRLVMLHLTVATTNNQGERAHSDMRTQVFVPDV